MKLRVFIERFVDVKPAVRKRLEKCNAEHLCTACLQPLGDVTAIRGTHPKCRKAQQRAIAAGIVTEEQLVQSGRLLEAASAGRKPSNLATIEMRLGTIS